MERINVSASKKYDIIIGEGIFSRCGEFLREVCKGSRAAVICDTTTKELFGPAVCASLEDAGFESFIYAVKAGEESKNAANFIDILNFLAEKKFNRADCIVALGGGVVGDLSGFVAASYLRGISFIQIPTTLLAAVDSSVGGKTAINLDAGKNLAGAFCQPSCVICDTEIIKNLPPEILSDGIAEVIKYGVIRNEKILDLVKSGVKENMSEIIGECVKIKARIVAADEFDTGERQLLNFGHTPAHAIEKKSNFKISHGHAVAAGMCIMSRAAEKLGLCEAGVAKEIEELCEMFSLPVECAFMAEELFEIAMSDKKRYAGKITLVVPKVRGMSELVKIPEEETINFFRAGLERK